RILNPEDDRPGTARNAVLSFRLWQSAFGGDRSVLGRDIRLNGRQCTVVGVMPPGFAFPAGDSDAPELWVPLQLDPTHPGGRGGHYLNVLGRLRAGATLPQLRSELTRYVIHARDTSSKGTHSFDPKFHPLVVTGFQDEVDHS